MKQLLQICLVLLLASGTCFAQSSEIDAYIKTGIDLYDNGDYRQAVEEFEKALKADAKHPIANYELSLTYLALRDYDNAILYADKAIKSKGSKDLKSQAYTNKGTALDLQGKPGAAVEAYKKAIKATPDHYLPYFNLGLTYYNTNNYNDAEQALISAVQLNPNHPSSHLLLGYTKQSQNLRAQSLLALYNFLLLEPGSERAATAFKELQRMHKQGVKQGEGEGGGMNISIGMPKDGDDGFSAAELMISMMQVSNAAVEKETGASPEQLFYNNTKSFFNVLGELKKEKKGFWWNYYVNFFYDMSTSGNVEAFSYYISQSAGNDSTTGWLDQNQDKVQRLSDWYNQVKR